MTVDVEPSDIWPIWPNGLPGGETLAIVPSLVERSPNPSAFRDRAAVGTIEPRLSIVRPSAPNGAGLLILPGGGYWLTTYDKEGLDIARVFAIAGVTCFVLDYRLPAEGWSERSRAPLQDAQRAIRMIRAKASEIGVDATRIAVLGSSAGGHLAGWLSVEPDPAYAPMDSIDDGSLRPDLTILNYPTATMRDPFVFAGCRQMLLGDTPCEMDIDRLSLECRDWNGAGPVCLIHAIDDDAVPVENTTELLSTLRRDGVPTEVHLFQKGGHGFAIRLGEGLPVRHWPDLVLAFGRDHGWL